MICVRRTNAPHRLLTAQSRHRYLR